MKRWSLLGLAACGGSVNVETSDAGPPDAATPEVRPDAAAADAVADAVDAASDAGACPRLGAPCQPGDMYCDENDSTKIWACFFGMWEHTTCSAPMPLCVPVDGGGHVCQGPVCK